VVQAGEAHAVVVVEPLVLPAGVGTDVGGGPLQMVLMLMLTRWVGGAWRIRHPVLWQSTSGWGCHSLPLLDLLVSTYDIVCYDGIAEEFRKGATSAEQQTLRELSG
jgi:hypothetical protein